MAGGDCGAGSEVPGGGCGDWPATIGTCGRDDTVVGGAADGDCPWTTSGEPTVDGFVVDVGDGAAAGGDEDTT
jgi:hypothetical protein